MSHSLNSLRAGYIGDYIGFGVQGLKSLKGVLKGVPWEILLGLINRDTRSLEYGSHEV